MVDYNILEREWVVSGFSLKDAGKAECAGKAGKLGSAEV